MSESDAHDTEFIATLPVTFARRRTVDAGAFDTRRDAGRAPPSRLMSGRRSFSSIGAYRSWSNAAESAGFPVGGMTMVLGLTQDHLVVCSTHLVRARPKRRAGAVALRDVAQITAVRSLLTARVIVLLRDGGFVELETMRVTKARRFVAAVMERKSQLR